MEEEKTGVDWGLIAKGSITSECIIGVVLIGAADVVGIYIYIYLYLFIYLFIVTYLFIYLLYIYIYYVYSIRIEPTPPKVLPNSWSLSFALKKSMETLVGQIRSKHHKPS